MLTYTQKTRKESRATVADWITGVFSVFWSVWWGFFMDQVLSIESKYIIDTHLVFSVQVETWKYLVFNILLIASFCYYYVKWLWSASLTAISVTFVADFARYTIPLFFSLLGILSSITMVWLSGNITENIALYGLILTPIWLVTVLITLWKAD